MMTPDAPKITYDVQDLFRYIDNLHDVSALVLDSKTRQYAPVDKDGLKAAIYEHLKNEKNLWNFMSELPAHVCMHVLLDPAE